MKKAARPLLARLNEYLMIENKATILNCRSCSEKKEHFIEPAFSP